MDNIALLSRIFPLTDEQSGKFRILLDCLDSSPINVTAISDQTDIVLKHFADSLSVYDSDFGKKAADVGSGGGFPALPLKIVHPQLDITVIDSTEKKVNFVKETAEKMGLCGMSFLAERAENIGTGEKRESFDTVTARAVANLRVLCEICLPLLKVGGMFYAMKGSGAQAELAEARDTIALLGGRVAEVRRVYFDAALSPEECDDAQRQKIRDFCESERYIVKIKKISPCPPKYPRAWGKIIKSKP